MVLSGSLNDGTAGLQTIKQRSGVAVVQSLDTALYPGMPRSAIDNVQVDHVVAPAEIASLLANLAMKPVEPLKVVPMSDNAPIEVPPDEIALADRQTQPGTPSTMTCPECHGTLWEVQDSELVKFRCRVGGELRRAWAEDARTAAEDLRMAQEDLRQASEQARQSADDARQAAVELRAALEHALKAASDQLTIMQELRESLIRSKDTPWER